MKYWTLTKLLAILGFSVAAGACCTGVEECEYGAPHADFEVKGKVTDATGEAIGGIRISVLYPEQDPYYFSEHAFTDKEGSYLSKQEIYWINGRFSVRADDVDGELNGGKFISDSKAVDLVREDFSEGDGWYKGKAEKTVDFVLEQELPVE